MWNLGEKNKGVDAGAVGLVHWDRDVQEAVPPPHLVIQKRFWPKIIFSPEYFADSRSSTHCSVSSQVGHKSPQSSLLYFQMIGIDIVLGGLSIVRLFLFMMSQRLNFFFSLGI